MEVESLAGTWAVEHGIPYQVALHLAARIRCNGDCTCCEHYKRDKDGIDCHNPRLKYSKDSNLLEDVQTVERAIEILTERPGLLAEYGPQLRQVMHPYHNPQNYIALKDNKSPDNPSLRVLLANFDESLSK